MNLAVNCMNDIEVEAICTNLRKISGQFKSQWGANAYAVIRSVIDTATKRNINIMKQIANIDLD